MVIVQHALVIGWHTTFMGWHALVICHFGYCGNSWRLLPGVAMVSVTCQVWQFLTVIDMASLGGYCQVWQWFRLLARQLLTVIDMGGNGFGYLPSVATLDGYWHGKYWRLLPGVAILSVTCHAAHLAWQFWDKCKSLENYIRWSSQLCNTLCYLNIRVCSLGIWSLLPIHSVRLNAEQLVLVLDCILRLSHLQFSVRLRLLSFMLVYVFRI